jgi:hypothetical protein
MLSQDNLIATIKHDLLVGNNAKPGIENYTLDNHLGWARQAGQNQFELKRIVKSLESNPLVGKDQYWRQLAERSANYKRFLLNSPEST